MALLFDIKNVSFPSIVKTNTPFKITGEVNLAGLPYFGLLWIAVTVTYPKQWWEFIGSPETAIVSISRFGNFEAEFPEGFDREGDYTMDIRAFLGPTMITSIGFISSASVTIPPLPSMVILPLKQFTVAGQGGETTDLPLAFDIGNPTINPSIVKIGEKTSITLPVKNIGTNSQTITVKIEVTEMGATGISHPGEVVGSQTFGPYTLQPGGTQKVVFDWTADGATKGKWIVVSILIDEDTLAPNTSPNNPAIFKQEFEVVSPVVSFQLLNPVINPTRVVQGQTTSITFDVVNNSDHAQAVMLHADITEMGATGISHPGETVDSYDNQTTIQPGEHWNPVWTWMAKGANTGKWIVVSLMDSSGELTPNTGPNNPNIFKQEFEVSTPGDAGISIVLQQPTPSSNPVSVGSKVTITVPFVMTAPASQMVKVKATLQYAGAGTSSIDAATQSKTVLAQTDMTTSASFTFNVDDGSDVGAVYSGGLNERKLKVDCYINDQFVAGNSFASVFNAQKIPETTPVLKISEPEIKQYERLSFSFSGFRPMSPVKITVVETGGYITKTSDADGNGSGSFTNSDPPGYYNLRATDSFGSQAVATFKITQAASEVIINSLNITRQAAYGQTATAQVGYIYKGSAANLILEVSIGAKSWYGGAFTVEDGMTWQQSTFTDAADSAAIRSGNLSFKIPSGVPAKLYDVLTRVLDQHGNELASRIDSGMITITSGDGVSEAKLTASYSNGICSYSFTGFQASAPILLKVVETGGNLTTQSNSSGAGSGSFYNDDPAGTYTLRATDNAGNSATATFTISSSVPSGPVSFQLSIAGTPEDFGSYQKWWAYYFDPNINDFVSGGKWYNNNEKVSFSNVKSGGYLAVFLKKDSETSNQYSSLSLAVTNGKVYQYNVQTNTVSQVS